MITFVSLKADTGTFAALFAGPAGALSRFDDACRQSGPASVATASCSIAEERLKCLEIECRLLCQKNDSLVRCQLSRPSKVAQRFVQLLSSKSHQAKSEQEEYWKRENHHDVILKKRSRKTIR